MTTANKITIFRVIMIPVFLVLAYTGHMYWALAVYIIACLSDMADGYIARHYNQISNFGKFADPLADKMLVLSAMCFFIENGQMPGWVVAVVLFREFAVSGLRLVAVLLFPQIVLVNIISSIIIVLTTVYSGVEYFWKNRDVFKDID